MQPKLKVFISGNGDITSDIVFGGLFDLDCLEVVGVSECATYTKERTNRIAQAMTLRRKMAGDYWAFLLFLNGCYAIRKLCEDVLWRHVIPKRILSLKARARNAKLPFWNVYDYNAPEFRAALACLNVDLHILRIGQLLTKDIVQVPRFGTWCLHSSVLPSYGGTAAEFHALARGETSLGSTLFKIAEGPIDMGPPVLQLRWTVARQHPLLETILSNNWAARFLVERAVSYLHQRGQTLNTKFDPSPPRSYYRWPTQLDISLYRDQGRRLISLWPAIRYACSSIFPMIGLPKTNIYVDYPPDVESS